MVDPAEKVTRASESFLSCFLQWPVMSARQTKTWEDFGNSNLTSHIYSTAILAIAGAGNQIQQPKGSWNTSKNQWSSSASFQGFLPRFFLFNNHVFSFGFLSNAVSFRGINLRKFCPPSIPLEKSPLDRPSLPWWIMRRPENQITRRIRFPLILMLQSSKMTSCSSFEVDKPLW